MIECNICGQEITPIKLSISYLVNVVHLECVFPKGDIPMFPGIEQEIIEINLHRAEVRHHDSGRGKRNYTQQDQ